MARLDAGLKLAALVDKPWPFQGRDAIDEGTN